MKKILLKSNLFLVLVMMSCNKDLVTKPNAGTTINNGKETYALVSGSGYSPSELTWRGMDLSFSYKIETQLSQTFHDIDGTTSSTFQIAKNHGVNLVRLRLMVNPPSYLAEATLSAVMAQALRLKAMGISFMLDKHYSDSWGDPKHQTKPAAWSSLTGTALINQATSYTTSVLTSLKSQGTTPVIVEVGNEILNGMLWPDFQISPTSTSNWSNFASLYNSLYAAVKGVDNTIQVMLHLNNYDQASLYFSNANTYGVNYDIMGFSYYSGWTGTDLNGYLSTMDSLVSSYNKPIMIAETAYQFTSLNSDAVANWWDSSYLTSGYPATLAGQYSYLQQLMWTVKSINSNKGIGLIFWAPEWVAYNGATESDPNYGSSMDNATLFDSKYYRANIGFNAFAATGTNLVNNGTFELDNAVTTTPSYWSTWSVNDYDANSTQTGSAYAGSWNCIHYKSTAYQVQTYQPVTGLENGNYTMTAYVCSSGGQSICRMEAKDFGGSNLYYNIPANSGWNQISIANINVTNHQCTVSFYSNASAGNWMAFDNVQFYKQ